jgi:hypothetical protein
MMVNKIAAAAFVAVVASGAGAATKYRKGECITPTDTT